MSKPSDQVLRWVAGELGGAAEIVEARGLRDGGSPWLLTVKRARSSFEVVLKAGNANNPDLRTQVAALAVANEHGVPAPTLIAHDLEGTAAGVPSMLTTALTGSSTIPVDGSTERLMALGAVAAALSRVSITPAPGLPTRTRPISFSDFVADRRRTGVTTPLLQKADDRVAELPTPHGQTCLVHGDLWQGNMMWNGDEFLGIVDWDCAGAGHYGIDLCSVRLDATLMFGPSSANVVLDGWQQTTGTVAEDVAYWDLVTATNMPTDLQDFVPAIHGQGRADLTARVLNDRRDAFLESALDRLSE